MSDRYPSRNGTTGNSISQPMNEELWSNRRASPRTGTRSVPNNSTAALRDSLRYIQHRERAYLAGFGDDEGDLLSARDSLVLRNIDGLSMRWGCTAMRALRFSGQPERAASSTDGQPLRRSLAPPLIATIEPSSYPEESGLNGMTSSSAPSRLRSRRRTVIPCRG